MYRDPIQTIDLKRQSRLLRISARTPNSISLEDAPRGEAVLYFLYTSYSDEELANAKSPIHEADVPIGALARARRNQANVCKVEQDGFRIVYNGGGIVSAAYGMEARIKQQFNAHPRTGSLFTRDSTVGDLDRWRYSFVTLPLTDRHPPADLEPEWSYEQHGRQLERYWRIEHGWPMLCRI
jgi:hypothetical protein